VTVKITEKLSYVLGEELFEIVPKVRYENFVKQYFRHDEEQK